MNSAERNNAGNALYAQGDYSLALQAYQEAMVADPDHPVPYYNAASALRQTGRLQAAAAALEQALKTADGPLAAAVYYNLGNVYFELARYEEALAAYREALLLDPQDGDARFNYELTLLRIATATPPQSQPTPSPTPDAAGASSPTSTHQTDAGENTPTPTGQPSNEESAPSQLDAMPIAPTQQTVLSFDEAARILDAVQRSQRTLRDVLQGRATDMPPQEKDW
ncbi:MAG: tetratricopeptide repeat protein [Aggregatilineales bacterium]